MLLILTMFLFSQKGIGELWQEAGGRENSASGEIRGIAHHDRASWGVVAASARCKALISLGFSEIFKHGVLGGMGSAAEGKYRGCSL